MDHHVLLLLFDGVEEIEAVTCIDLIRRADIKVTTVSLNESFAIRGRSNIKVMSDKLFSDIVLENFSALVVPGGPGVFEIQGREKVLKSISHFKQRNCLIAGICAAPILLDDAGVFKDNKFTCHRSVQNSIKTGCFINQAVVISNNVITSKGAGTAISFALCIIRGLKSQDYALEITNQIHYEDSVE